MSTHRLVVSGSKLIELREAAELTQERAAVGCGLTAARLGQLEREGGSIRTDTLGRLARLYGVEPQDLLAWEDEAGAKPLVGPRPVWRAPRRDASQKREDADPLLTAVVCDRHPLWLEAVEQVLRRVGVREIVKTTSATAALSLVKEHQPDLLVAEIESGAGEISGLELITRSRAAVSSLRPIVLSIHQDSHVIDAAFVAGARAYVVKTAHPDDIASAVRQAFDHSIYLAGRSNLAPAAVEVSAQVDEEAIQEEPILTRRELEILRLVADGHSNAELARMLWVTEQTVKFHLSNVYRKINVANRTEASRWAQVHGLLEGHRAAFDVA